MFSPQEPLAAHRLISAAAEKTRHRPRKPADPFRQWVIPSQSYTVGAEALRSVVLVVVFFVVLVVTLILVVRVLAVAVARLLHR